MVRLKDRIYTTTRKNRKISIPYGAIKSQVGGFRYATSVGFQFLMVRLKAARSRLAIVEGGHFNSLWCD